MRTLWIILCLLVAACGPEATPAPGAQPSATPPASALTPVTTPNPGLAQPDQAIALAQKQFPQLREIKPTPPNSIGASSNIWALQQPDGWNLVFWQGDGDCPAGCINNHYWYVSVDRSGAATMVGEYDRHFVPGTNSMQSSGDPLWGIPKP